MNNFKTMIVILLVYSSVITVIICYGFLYIVCHAKEKYVKVNNIFHLMNLLK